MSASSRTIPERVAWALVGTVIVSAVAFWRPSLDVFGHPKFAVLVFGIAVAGAIATYNSVSTGRLHVPWGPPAWVAVAFAALVVVIFLLDPTARAFMGGHSRHTGALFYVSLAVAALMMMRAAGSDDSLRWFTTRDLALGVVAAGGLVAGIGVLQLLGVDPLERVGDPVVTATFNNPNFAAAMVGTAVPAAAWALWDRAHGPVLRVIGGLALIAMIATAVGTRSIQGPVTAGAGLLVFTLAVLLGVRDDRVRRVAVGIYAVFTAAVATVMAASLVGRGPFGALADAANVELRLFYWSAGFRMFSEHPFAGVGLERYGAYFGEFRSEAAARRLDLSYAVDAAHNVPIQLFATGGLFVGLAYVAFVVLTALALFRAFQRTAGRPRLLVGALGGVWAGYQAQSLVSIDTPPLALLHWLSAAAIIGWSGMVGLRAVDLPWASSRRKVNVRRRQRVGGAVLAAGLVALFVLMLAPLRAGTAAARGAALADAGRHREGLKELEAATSGAAWEPIYWQRLGNVALGADRPELAMDAYQRALEREPRSIVALVTAARIAAAKGDNEAAAEFFNRALEVDPLAPTLLVEAADFFQERGDGARADELRQRADRIAR